MDAFAANPPIRRRIPSFRNRQVFEEVVVKDRSKTDVAAQFGLTQPRVSQIVEQVEDWLRQVVSPDGNDWPADERLRYAQNVTQLRLDSQLKETMAGWELSIKDKVVRRDSYSPTGELRGWTLTTTNQCGKSSHINQALNLSLALARLAGVDVTGKSTREDATRASERAATGERAKESLQAAVSELAAKRQETAAREQDAMPQDFEPSKPLWNSEPQQAAAEVQIEEPTEITACEPTVCTDKPDEESASISPQNGAQNSYEFQPLDAQEDWLAPAQEDIWSGEDWEELDKEDADGARKELLAVA